PWLWHIFRQDLQGQQSTLCFADNFESGPEIAASEVAFMFNLLPVYKSDHSESRNFRPVPTCRCHSLTNQFTRQRPGFSSETRIYPSPRPCVLGVLRIRPARYPQGTVSEKHEATARRNELRSSGLLPIVMTIRNRQRFRIESVRN